MGQIELNEFKQAIAQIYDGRRDTYDRNGLDNWHYKLACRLVECAAINPGQRVLDLATGTGMVAIEAAKQMNYSGEVIGIDIAAGLLAVAQQKIDIAGLNDLVRLQLADIETLNFSEKTCDRILCCSALPLLTNVPGALRMWRSWLKPEGKLGLCVFAETAFVTGVVLQKVARRYGINLVMSDLTGTEAKTHELLTTAGYSQIEIITEQYGYYTDLASVGIKDWDISLQHPHCWPLLNLEPQQLEQLQTEYTAELSSLVTKQGIWNDITTYFVIANKQGPTTASPQ
ncbi:MAG: methyltransferase domain-containing protein [Cyanobacteria bacterium J06623_7]